jgi:glutathione synthase
MNILFVADPLESFKIYKDTTFAMMRAKARPYTGCVRAQRHSLAAG